MKKIFTYMMMFVAVAMFTTSCGDDEDNFDYEAAIKNLTGNFWEGYNTEQYKEWGGFVDKGDRHYVVIRFDRSAAAAMNGTGWQLEFDSPYKNECTDKCDFMWRLDGDIITISYRKSGWKSVTFNIREMTLNSSKFSGYLYVVDDHRYTINYDKSTFSDWSKYTNN